MFLSNEIFSSNYHYSAWIDRDSYINIAQVNFDPFAHISTTKSNIKIKGITIDCKAFEKYGDIICVFVGNDDCNLNVYNKEVPSDYSQALLQPNNLLDLGFDCDISSPAQKIHNIDGNKFFVCYNKKDSNTFSLYCILGEHVSKVQ